MGERGIAARNVAWAAKSVSSDSSAAQRSAVASGQARPDSTGHPGGKKN